MLSYLTTKEKEEEIMMSIFIFGLQTVVSAIFVCEKFKQKFSSGFLCVEKLPTNDAYMKPRACHKSGEFNLEANN
jgi:hypothetical protein